MTTDLADLGRLPEIEEQRGGDPELLFAELKAIITHAIANHPRSLQKRIGPSEIGDPCARRIAYKLTGTPEARELPTPWRPTVGTATHTWLEEKLAEYNQATHAATGASRFLIEQRVNAGPCAGADLEGSTDWYDRVTATVGDWKIVGPSSLKKLRADLNAGRGPRLEYRVQGHTYGLGWLRRGLPVDRVMIVALPAAGELADAVMWTEPFNPQIARDAMARVDRIHALTSSLAGAALTVTNGALAVIGRGDLADPDGNPGAPAIGTDGHGCRFCPWLKASSTDPATGCPGAPEQIAQTQANEDRQLKGLIA
jgi:hypothetical protein